MGVVTLTSTPPPGYALLYNGPPGQGGVVDHSSLGSFPYVEEIDGYRESWRSDGAQQVTRRFKVRWGGRKSFVDYMLGWSTTLGGGGSVTLTNGPPPPEVGGSGNTLQSSPPATTPALSRQIPDQVPEDGFRHLYCSEVNMVGGKGIIGNNPNVQVFLADGSQALDANGNAVTKPMIAYFDPVTKTDGWAFYECVYTPRPYEVRTDDEMGQLQGGKGELERYVEFSRENALQAQPLPQKAGYGLYWQDGFFKGQLIPDNAAFIYLHTQTLLYTWHEVPDEPRDSIRACVGTVSSADFDGARGRMSYPAGTLLCQAPPKVERYRHPNGRVYWRVVYSELFRPTGWNFLPDASGVYNPVAFGTSAQPLGGAPLYPTADHAQLFAPPSPVTYQ